MLWTLAAWVPMLVWLAAFYPGLMSPDSLNMWSDATTGHWHDIQSPLYIATLWVSKVLTDSPALVTLGQTLLLAAAIVAVTRALVRLGVPARLMVVVAAGVAVAPMVGAFSVSLWKDVPYSAAVLFAAARVVDLVIARSRRDVLGARRALVMIGIWLAVATLLRQNGILLAAALLVVLVATLPGVRVRSLLTLACVVMVLLTVKVVVYPLTGIEATPTQAKLNTQLQDIAWMFRKDPAAFSKSDRDLLETVAPLDQWRGATREFGCYNANWEADPTFHWKRMDGHAGEWNSLWLHLLVTHPDAVIDSRLCVGSIAWNPRLVGPQSTVNRGIEANDFGLETTPLSDWLHRKALAAIVHMDEPGNLLWAWRAPRWIYLADLAVGFAAVRRRKARLALVALPMLAQQLSVVAASPAQDARYMMASFILALLLLPVAFVDLARGSSDPVVEDLDELGPTDSPVPDSPGSAVASAPGVAAPES